MSDEPIQSASATQSSALAQVRRRRSPAIKPSHMGSHGAEQEAFQHQAELFYMQKQIQAQTPMIVVLQDGQQIEGCIEWYDRDTLKLRGRQKTLVYKSAIKFMYKKGDPGQ